MRACLVLAAVGLQRTAAQGMPPGMMSMGGGGEDEVETQHAEELKDETFDERLAEYDLVMVYFREKGYASKQMDAEVELASSELSISDEAIFIGKVDLSDAEAKGAAKKAKVTEGPVIKCFRRGKPLPFGPNNGDARSIVSFMRYLSAPVSQWLSDATAVNEWLRDQPMPTILGIFADTKRPTHNLWIKQAEALRPPFRFAETSVEAAKAAKLFADAPIDETKNQFAVVRPAKWVAKSEAAYFLSSDFKAMVEFVKEHAQTKVAPLSSWSRQRYVDEHRALVSVSFDQQKMGKMFKYIVNRLHKLFAAEPDLEKRYAFTIIGSQQAAGMAKDFGVPGDKDFVVTVANLTTMQVGCRASLILCKPAATTGPILPPCAPQAFCPVCTGKPAALRVCEPLRFRCLFALP